MVKEVTMYTVICDGCGKDSNYDNEYAAWSDKGYAVDCAENADFIEHEGNHYCPKCYHYNDQDELVILPQDNLFKED